MILFRTRNSLAHHVITLVDFTNNAFQDPGFAQKSWQQISQIISLNIMCDVIWYPPLIDNKWICCKTRTNNNRIYRSALQTIIKLHMDTIDLVCYCDNWLWHVIELNFNFGSRIILSSCFKNLLIHNSQFLKPCHKSLVWSGMISIPMSPNHLDFSEMKTTSMM